MARTSHQLRQDLLSIWQAGVAAVDSQWLVERHVQVANGCLRFTDASGGEMVTLPLEEIRHFHVVGGGKASAGMAAGLEKALGTELMRHKSTTGWINVPSGSELPTEFIHLHAARPAGRNEPTVAAQHGSEVILEQVAQLGSRDVCIVLLSGGGSALLPAPRPPVTLADKVTVTRWLSGAGADIHELNTVRTQLSRIKGGGLARACRAGHLITLVISDVLGDPLDMIASGPTVETQSTADDARRILTRYATEKSSAVPLSVWEALRAPSPNTPPSPMHAHVHTCVIGNIEIALRGAQAEAALRGYDVQMASIDLNEPTAEEVADRIVVISRELAEQAHRVCYISGGEPIVRLAPLASRGKGGRNQQLVLAALHQWLAKEDGGFCSDFLRRIAFLSGGTDGEDGPTDAAGAMIWPDLVQSLVEMKINPSDFLARNDAYHFLGPLGCLMRTGPTNTNVCDVRVLLVDEE